MVLNKTKILNKYTKVKSKQNTKIKSKQIKNNFSHNKKIIKSVKKNQNKVGILKLKKKYTIKMIQKGGKGDSNNNGNITNVASGLFNTFSSAVSSASSVLPPEISGKNDEEKNTTVSNDNNKRNKQIIKEPTIMELIKKADMINPGDFKTYSGSNPFIIENKLDEQCK